MNVNRKLVVAGGTAALVGAAVLGASLTSSSGESSNVEAFLDEAWSTMSNDERVEACMGMEMFGREMMIDMIDTENTQPYEEWKEEDYENDPELYDKFTDEELREIHNNMTGEQVVSYFEGKCND